MCSDSDFSAALVMYLGYGLESWPRCNRQRLLEALGAERTAKIAPMLEGLVGELDSINIDWSAHSLETAAKVVQSEMRRRHPSLSEQALSALEWKFTFDWK